MTEAYPIALFTPDTQLLSAELNKTTIVVEPQKEFVLPPGLRLISREDEDLSDQ